VAQCNRHNKVSGAPVRRRQTRVLVSLMATTAALDRAATTWDADSVTQATRKMLEEFEALPDQERSELVAELARRVALLPHDAPTDDDLVAAADRLFVQLDRREQS
jgi:hypothetical protein